MNIKDKIKSIGELIHDGAGSRPDIVELAEDDRKESEHQRENSRESDKRSIKFKQHNDHTTSKSNLSDFCGSTRPDSAIPD